MLTLLTIEKERAKEELQKYVRHMNFINKMEKYGHCENINWNCFWSWFYQSNISADEAFQKSKEKDQKGNGNENYNCSHTLTSCLRSLHRRA